MKITIEMIPHDQQRYPTCGDWQWDELEENLTIKVSQMPFQSFFLVGIHELVEAILCALNGTTQESVDKFDMSNPELNEPGDDPNAPYHEEHQVAKAIEILLAKAIDIRWTEHERNIEKNCH